MSDMARDPRPHGQQQRQPSHEHSICNAPAVAVVVAAGPQIQSTGATSAVVLDVILSIRDTRYKKLMHDILGQRSPNIAVQIFSRFQAEGARFYVLDEGGNPSRVKEEKAFHSECCVCILLFQMHAIES